MHKAPIISLCNEVYNVPVLIGAADELVTLREKKNVYNVNPHLKYWATFFLLKASTTSGKLNDWNKQKQQLLQYLRLSDATFRKQLATLTKLELVTVTAGNITLNSYKEAARILGITYKGETTIIYKPQNYKNETQVFQYLLVAQEIESNRAHQTAELHRKFQKNLSGNATELHLLLKQYGYNPLQLQNNAQEFQQALLRIQQSTFRDKSGLTNVAFSLRADVNRSCKAWAGDHSYKSASSASYIKKKLHQLQVAVITKTTVESTQRCRFYYTDKAGKKKEGFKWNKKALQTIWRLCDHVSVNLAPPPEPLNLKNAA